MKRVYLWRWFSGHAMNGQHHTNAGWFARGDKILHPTGRASKWHHLPRARRAMWRWTWTGGVLVTIWGLAAAPWETLAVLGAMVAGAVWLAVRAVQRWKRARDAKRPIPRLVRLADVMKAVSAAKETRPVLGMALGRKLVHADLDDDSPHILVSAGSGGGKSVIMRLIVAQILAHGGICLILDVKRMSHRWARGLPNVRYCRTIEEIHEACLWLRPEVERRNELADEGADIDGNTEHVDVGPRLFVLAEEMNATSNRLAAYWKTVKQPGQPNASPAVEALGDAYFMGRQVKVNVGAVAQMFTARTAGGPEARENFGTRILARYTMNNWRVLVPEIWPMPAKSRRRGRVQVCCGGVATETQIVLATPKECRALATSGTVTPFPQTGDAMPGMPTLEKLPAVRAVGLAEACASGLLPMTLDAARKARTRGQGFPEHVTRDGQELLYDPADLRTWAGNRPRALVGADHD